MSLRSLRHCRSVARSGVTEEASKLAQAARREPTSGARAASLEQSKSLALELQIAMTKGRFIN